MQIEEFFRSLAQNLSEVFEDTNDAAQNWLERYTESVDKSGVRSLKKTRIRNGDETYEVAHVAFASPSLLQMKRICLDLDVSVDTTGGLALQLDGKDKDKHTAHVHIELERVPAPEGQFKVISKIDNAFQHQDLLDD